MKRFLLIALLLSAPLWADGGKRAMTFEDVFAAARIQAPVLSPDGRLVAFTVRVADLDANKFHSAVYVVDLEGKGVRKVAGDKGNASTPGFRDAYRLTYLGTVDGETQVYEIDLAGSGDPVKLTAVPGGAGDYVWTPDARRLVFQKDVYPAAASLEGSVAQEKARDESKVKARLLTSLMYRVWNSWKEGMRSHLFLTTPGGTDFTDLTSGEGDTPPVDLGGPCDFAVSPDGKLLAYVRNPDPVVAISTNNDVFLRDLAAGTVENVSAANKANDAGVVFSPKGTYLAYLSMRRAGFEADKREIVLYHLKNKTFTNISAQFPQTVSEFAFAPDEKTVYFIARQGVHNPVFRQTLKSGKIECLVPGRNTGALSVTPDGQKLVFAAQSVQRPTELFRYDLKKGRLTQLTRLNEPLMAGLELNPLETFQFTGGGDETVEALLIKPPFFDPQKKYPMAFLVHGGPQGGWTDDFHYRWNHSLFAAKGYVVVAVNFHGSDGYGQPFTDAVSRDWGGVPFVDLVRGQQYAVEHFPFIDPDRIVAAGASYGGFMINWMAGHIDEFKYPFRALVCHDGIFDARSMYYTTEELWFEEWEHGGVPWQSDLFEKWNPARFVDKFKVPMLVVHSENDFRVPVSQGFMLFTALQRRGIDSKMLYYPDEDHFVSKPQNARLWWNTVFDWFTAHLQ